MTDKIKDDVGPEDFGINASDAEKARNYAAFCLAEESERSAKLAAWLQWCLDNCDDSPEYNFGATATEHIRALLVGKPAPMPGT